MRRYLSWMDPIWSSETVTDECLLFTEDESGVRPCGLLFRPERILKVYCDYEDTEYREGKDYKLEDGRLVRAEGSRIPYFALGEMFLDSPNIIPIKSASHPDKYVRYEPNGVETLKRQLRVTYIRKGGQRLALPKLDPGLLPRTLNRLKRGMPLHIVFYGDSFIEGCDASGRTGIAPYMPTIDKLTVFKLSSFYNHSKISYVNTAVGGTVSAWGLENIGSRVIANKPDLTILRFGMNDGSGRVPAKEVANNMRLMVDKIRQSLPDSEILIMTTEYPNPDCDGWTGTQGEIESALDEKIPEGNGVAFVRIMELFKSISKVKDFYSLCTNFVNHPNDFMIRLYAQLFCAALGAYPEENDENRQ